MLKISPLRLMVNHRAEGELRLHHQAGAAKNIQQLEIRYQKRQMQINGIGTTLLGVSQQDEHNQATATVWFTFVYLPVLPLGRLRVEFLPHSGSGFSYRKRATTPLHWGEIVQTYFLGWVVVPLIVFGPLIVAVKEIWQAFGLPVSWQIPYILVGCAWVGLLVWKLSAWQEKRCRPRHASTLSDGRKQA